MRPNSFIPNSELNFGNKTPSVNAPFSTIYRKNILQMMNVASGPDLYWSAVIKTMTLSGISVTSVTRRSALDTKKPLQFANGLFGTLRNFAELARTLGMVFFHSLHKPVGNGFKLVCCHSIGNVLIAHKPWGFTPTGLLPLFCFFNRLLTPELLHEYADFRLLFVYISKLFQPGHHSAAWASYSNYLSHYIIS
jgi:hypothetical protein